MLNDFSGSPKVLEGVLEGLMESGMDVELFTSSGGVLDRLPPSPLLRRHPIGYTFNERNLPLSFLKFLYANSRYFFRALGRKKESGSIFYINTIMPFGAALGAKLRGNRVVYHCHEYAYSKGVHYRLFSRIMEWVADDIICVSAHQASSLKRRKGVRVIANSLDPEFVERLKPDADKAFERRTVLMVCSLRSYKGIEEFARLADRMPDVRFELVANDTERTVAAFAARKEFSRIANLSFHPRTADVAEYYNRASVVVNLSNTQKFTETFGMTVIEAKAAGLPAIVPPRGGIADLVEEGKNGYHIGVERLEEVRERLREMLDDRELYRRLSREALADAKRFRRDEAIRAIRAVIEKNSLREG